MGYISRIHERRAMSKQQDAIFERSTSIVTWGDSITGKAVNEESAMRMSAVNGCVRVLSETVGSLPLIVYKRLKEGKERAVDHYLYSILHEQPNEYQTSMQFRETLMCHVLLWGNAYAEIMAPKGKVEALIPRHPSDVKMSEDGRFYEIDNERKIPYHQMLHVPGLGFDGRLGKSPIAMAKEAIGLGLAAEEFGSRFYANDARPGIALSHPGTLSEDAAKRLSDSWSSKHGGLDNAHGVAVLEEGMKVETFTIPPEDAQFLELRKFQVEEIARIYRVPLHMIQMQEKSTSWGSGIEQLGIGFVVYTLRPWLVRWEQAITSKLLLPAERKTYFAEFLVDGLLRGDAAARGAYYREQWNIGALSQNEIRALENRNPVPGGDDYYVPMNMTPVGAPPAPVRAIREVRAKPSTRKKVRESYEKIFIDAYERVLKGERRNVSRAMKSKDTEVFKAWMDKFFHEDNVAYVANELRGPLTALAEAIFPLAQVEVGGEGDMSNVISECMDAHVDAMAYRWSMVSHNRIMEVLTGVKREKRSDFIDEVEALYDAMITVRPKVGGNWESVRIDGLITKAVISESDATDKLVWSNEGCGLPFCEELDGSIVDLDGECKSSPFLTKGEMVEHLGKTLQTGWNVVTPPLAPGCTCSIGPYFGG